MTGTAAGGVAFVCPRCKGTLDAPDPAAQGPSTVRPEPVEGRSVPRYSCRRCAREYPVLCGIPDFRLQPDPYISIEDDRRKGEALLRAAAGHSFEWLVRHYYSITPGDPPDLAARWTARTLVEVAIAEAVLRDAGLTVAENPVAQGPSTVRPEPVEGRTLRAGFSPASSPLLDIGCSTGALLIAARDRHGPLIGVDVAFRWLAVAQVRLQEAGVAAALVCANAEHLPFPDRSFETVTATDLLEHARDAASAIGETARVAAPGATLLCTANNRYAPLPEPNVHLWGVGYLPRRWQARYVAAVRGDLHPYRICLRSARELERLARDAGWTRVRARAAKLYAPHVESGVTRRALAIYNRLTDVPVIGPILTRVGPRLTVLAVRWPAQRAPASSRVLRRPSP